MLIRYSVSNFLSFNKEQTISFAASQGTRHKDHLISLKENKLLRSSIIYGANASGKSNLIESIDFSLNLIIKGLESVDFNNKYFKLDTLNYSIPGVFQYDLAIGDEVYSYGIAISYSERNIVSEWLYTGKNLERCIFDRNIDNNNAYNIESEFLTKVKANSDDKKRFDIYCEDYQNSSIDMSKRVFLTDIATRTSNDSSFFKHFKDVFNELKNIIVIFPNSKYRQLSLVAKDLTLRQKFERYLSCFDTGIEQVVNKKVEFDKIFSEHPDSGELDKIKTDISNKLHRENNYSLRLGKDLISLDMDENGKILVSKMLLNHGNEENLFEYAEESDGTQRLFDLIPLFFEEHKNCLIIIDEIDRSLHNRLIHKFFELYFKFSTNSNSQIMVTTHETSLMDLDLFRQDEIWFVERDNKHSSNIYSLNKFKERYDKDVEKEYLLGKYGAVPLFTQVKDDEDDNE